MIGPHAYCLITKITFFKVTYNLNLDWKLFKNCEVKLVFINDLSNHFQFKVFLLLSVQSIWDISLWNLFHLTEMGIVQSYLLIWQDRSWKVNSLFFCQFSTTALWKERHWDVHQNSSIQFWTSFECFSDQHINMSM